MVYITDEFYPQNELITFCGNYASGKTTIIQNLLKAVPFSKEVLIMSPDTFVQQVADWLNVDFSEVLPLFVPYSRANIMRNIEYRKSILLESTGIPAALLEKATQLKNYDTNLYYFDSVNVQANYLRAQRRIGTGGLARDIEEIKAMDQQNKEKLEEWLPKVSYGCIIDTSDFFPHFRFECIRGKAVSLDPAAPNWIKELAALFPKAPTYIERNREAQQRYFAYYMSHPEVIRHDHQNMTLTAARLQSALPKLSLLYSEHKPFVLKRKPPTIFSEPYLFSLVIDNVREGQLDLIKNFEQNVGNTLISQKVNPFIGDVLFDLISTKDLLNDIILKYLDTGKSFLVEEDPLVYLHAAKEKGYRTSHIHFTGDAMFPYENAASERKRKKLPEQLKSVDFGCIISKGYSFSVLLETHQGKLVYLNEQAPEWVQNLAQQLEIARQVPEQDNPLTVIREKLLETPEQKKWPSFQKEEGRER